MRARLLGACFLLWSRCCISPAADQVPNFLQEAFGIQRGFWGLVAKGATFKSVPGRRLTRPGQELIRAHRAALKAMEDLVNTHVSAWRAGASTPAGPVLDAMLARWRALPVGEELRLVWPRPHVPRKNQDAAEQAEGVR